MGSNYEPDETENHLWSTDSNEEMKFRLKSLRSIVSRASCNTCKYSLNLSSHKRY